MISNLKNTLYPKLYKVKSCLNDRDPGYLSDKIDGVTITLDTTTYKLTAPLSAKVGLRDSVNVKYLADWIDNETIQVNGEVLTVPDLYKVKLNKDDDKPDFLFSKFDSNIFTLTDDNLITLKFSTDIDLHGNDILNVHKLESTQILTSILNATKINVDNLVVNNTLSLQNINVNEKITGDTIQATSINSSQIETDDITVNLKVNANTVSAQSLESVFSTLNNATISTLDSEEATVKKLTTDILHAKQSTLDSCSIDILNANNVVIQEGTADRLTVSILLEATNGEFNKISITNGHAENLIVDKISITQTTIDSGSFNSIDVTDLTAQSAQIQSAQIDSSSINTLHITSLNGAFATITSLECDSLESKSATIKTIHSDALSTLSLESEDADIQMITIETRMQLNCDKVYVNEKLVISTTGNELVATFANTQSVINSDSDVKGNLVVEKDLTVDGNSLIKGNLSVNGNSTVVGNLSAAGDLLVEGNSTIKGDLTVEGDLSVKGTLVEYSDISLKKDISIFSNGLDIVENINPKTYIRISTNSKEVGFIAQDIQKYFPDAVRSDEQGLLAINPISLIAVLWNAVKELSQKVKELESRN